MARADNRTSLIVGPEDLARLQAAIDAQIQVTTMAFERTGSGGDDLLRLFLLRTRLGQAADRLEAKRLGRGSGGAA